MRPSTTIARATADAPSPAGSGEARRAEAERLPRYTSYPTANRFEAVSAADYRAWLAELPERARLSLYLHIPFCRDICWYCGCHTKAVRRSAPVERYLEDLLREIETVARLAGLGRPVGHVHLGGGTPTIAGPDGLRALFAALAACFRLEPGAEIAIEVDPRTLTAEIADTLGEAGVTRASLGVQTFDPRVQEAINRVQSFAETAAAVGALRGAGVRAINLDVLYGLPGQTVQGCLDTVARCLELRPDRLAVFGYAHVVAMKPHQRLIDAATLPDAGARREQAEAIGEALLAAGYRRIGFDHFALPEDDLARAAEEGRLRRNFQGYTTDTCDALIGFGASAIGRLPQGYVQNEVAVGLYGERIAREGLATVRGRRLTDDDRLRAEIIARLMCDLEVDVAEVCARHGADAAAVLGQAMPRLRQLAGEGIVSLDGPVVRVPEAARLLVQRAASAFDAYLEGAPSA